MIYLNILWFTLCMLSNTKGALLDTPNPKEVANVQRNVTKFIDTNTTNPPKTSLHSVKPTSTVAVINNTILVTPAVNKTVEQNTTFVVSSTKEVEVNSTTNTTTMMNNVTVNSPKNSDIPDSVVNNTLILDCHNTTHTNFRCFEKIINDTISSNHTAVAQAIGASSDSPIPFTPKESVAIAAAICLVSAIIGYLSCVGYRKFLEKKYGNSQILVTEDVYDTTDLRYFEI